MEETSFQASRGLETTMGLAASPALRLAMDKLAAYRSSLSGSRPSSPPGRRRRLLDALQELEEAIGRTLELVYDAEGNLEGEEHQGAIASVLEEIKGAAFEAEDLADDLEYESLRNKSAAGETSAAAVDPEPITEKMRMLTAQLESLIATRSTPARTIFQPLFRERRRPPSTSRPRFFGREEEIEKLTEKLMEEGESISVLAVVGTAGAGKTALARRVFDGDRAARRFQRRAWVRVGEVFDMEMVMKQLVQSTFFSSSSALHHSEELQLLEAKLKQNLAALNFLLVLDDVRCRRWTEIMGPLRSSGARSIKVLVTARWGEVLAGAGEMMELGGLDEDNYWHFFEQCVFGVDEEAMDGYREEPALRSIGRDVASKLHRNPLAGEMIGGLLGCRLKQDHWALVHHLPRPLRRCFELCSIYPKGHSFAIDREVGLWMALSLVDREKTGREFFAELASRGFFFSEASPGHQWRYGMHDLLHDFAQSVAAGESFSYRGGGSSNLFVGGGPIDISSASPAKNLRALVLYRELKKLRFLDISRTAVESLPESICGLYHLETLILPSPQCRLPVRIVELSKLRRISPAPATQIAGVGRLTRLSALPHFKVGNEDGYRVRELKDMNELEGDLCISNLEYAGDATEANLERKSRIEKLNLFWTEVDDDMLDDEAFTGNAEKVLEGLNPHPNLRRLNIDEYLGFRAPAWLASPALENLSIINLTGCWNLQSLAPIRRLPSLATLSIASMSDVSFGDDEADDGLCFPCLRHLEISHCRRVRGFQPFTSLPALQTLNLIGNPWLDDLLPGCLIGLCSITALWIKKQWIESLPEEVVRSWESLEYLYVDDCPELGSVGGLEALAALNTIRFQNCPKITTLAAGGKEEEDEAESFPAKLCNFKINNCTSLESMPPWLPRVPSLGYLSLSSCPILFPMPPLDGLHNLTRLHIGELEIVSLPTEAMGVLVRLDYLYVFRCQELSRVQGLKSLVALKHLHIVDCRKLEFWKPEDGSAGEEREDGGGDVLLPSELKHFSVSGSERMEGLPEWVAMLPALEWVRVSGCPEFKRLPDGKLPASVKQLIIQGCDAGFMARCMEEGSVEQAKIQHIPEIIMS